MIRDEYIKQASSAMMLEHERQLHEALNDCMPGWCVMDVQKRCVIQRIAGQLGETLLVDGKPVMWWGEFEFSEPQRTNDAYRINVTRKYRRLDNQMAAIPPVPLSE